MRIAVVHSFYDESRPSGENEVVLDQVEQLTRNGDEVMLIARHTSEQARHRFYPLTSAITITTGRGRSPAHEIDDFGPDLVHLHNTFPNWGTQWLRHWGTRTVATMHNFRTLCANGLLARGGRPCTECLALPVLPAVRHACYRSSPVASIPLAVASAPSGALHQIPSAVARVIVLNDSAAEIFRSVYHRQIDVVPNFVAPSNRLSSPTRSWAYVGRLGEEKGVRQLLSIWPPDVELDVVGSGPLSSFVRDHAHSNHNVHPLGSIPRSEVLERLPQYTGIVLPSMCAEGLPLVMLEALAAGIPLLISDRISSAEEIVGSGAGRRFDPTSDRGALRRTLADIEECGPQMRLNARTLHDARYSPRAWQDKINQIYADVYRSAPAQAPVSDGANHGGQI